MKKSLLLLLLSIFVVCLPACKNEKEQAVDELKTVCAQVNAECPMQVDEYTIWTSTELTDTDFVYNYTALDPEGYDIIEVITSVQDEFRSELAKNIKRNKDFKHLQELLVKAGYGVKYLYTSQSTGEQFAITFSPEEIANMQ